MKARRAKFKVDFLDGEYEGYVFDGPGNTFNGYACPYLTYESKAKFLEDIQAWSAEMVETEDGDIILFPVGNQQLNWMEVN